MTTTTDRCTVERFRLDQVDTDGMSVAGLDFEATGDLVVDLHRGGVITSGTIGRAVLVLLEVDDDFTAVRVQCGGEGDLATVEDAIGKLETVRDELRRLGG